jgi:hypothetical protein
MLDPMHLRDLAARMFALAIQTQDREFAEHLARRASDYLDQAAELEKAAAPQPQPDEPEKT